MKQQNILRAASVFVIVIGIVVILVYGKPFLVPLAFAAIIAMLLLPITRWLESKGVNRILSIAIVLILLLAVIAGFVALLSWQVSDLTSDMSKFEQRLTETYHKARQFITEKFGISAEKQEQALKKSQESGGGQSGGMIKAFLMGFGTLLTNFILMLVYIFLLIYFRGKLKGFITRLVPENEKQNSAKIIDSAQKVSQKYVTGLFMMIVFLWVMYSIGFAIAGVKNFVFFAILCGILEIVPFIGNLTGTALTIAMSVIQGGGSGVIIGILITYAFVQFIQTYILEPLIVGAEVNINPLFTIIGIVAGEMLWGIPGMILALPVLGMLKIVCDHVEPLKPYGYLIGEDKKKDSGIGKKIKGMWRKAVKREA